MPWSEAEEILRRHVIERRRRASVRSVILDDDQSTAMPRMSDLQFADSCSLVRGVPQSALEMLEAWHCESAGSTWTVDAVQIRGRMTNIPIKQVAMRLTLRQAAEHVGLMITFKEARALYKEAMSIVLDNLVSRASREEAACVALKSE